MNRNMRKITVVCLTICSTITLNTTCMLLCKRNQSFKNNPRFLLQKKRVAPQYRFYGGGAEVTNAQLLTAIQENTRDLEAAVQNNNQTLLKILEEIRKQSLQTPTTKPLTTLTRDEVDYGYKPENLQKPDESEKLYREHLIHYGNR